MAEALLRARFGGRSGARVESAGVAALVGRPAEPEAQRLLSARGLDLSGHRARQVTPELVSVGLRTTDGPLGDTTRQVVTSLRHHFEAHWSQLYGSPHTTCSVARISR